MYYFIPVNDKPQKYEDKETFIKMDEISSQWEDKATAFGKLLMGVFDWDYTTGKMGIELKIPNLRAGGSIPKNEIATSFFGFDIYGDCFLKPKENKINEIDAQFFN